jgi:ATP-binding cassette subfamily B multidrug efflux pump
MKNLKKLIPYFRKHRLELATGFLFMLLYNYSLMKIPVFIRAVVDEVGKQNRPEIIYGNFLKIFLFTMLVVVSLFLMRKLIISVSRKIEYLLREKIFNKLMCLGYIFYRQNETGDLVSRCTNDLNDVRTLLGPGVMYIPNSLSRLILFLPVLIGLSGSLMSIILVMLLFLVILIVVLIPRMRPLFRKIQELAAKISNRTWQVISGISTIKLNNLEQIEIDRFKELNRDYIKKHMAVVKFREGLWPFFMFVFSLTELVILLVGGRQVIAGQLTIGELFQFTIMISALTFPILSLGWIMSLMQQGISAMGRINYILDQPEEECKNLQKLVAGDLDFEIKNLDYAYPDAEQNTLENINLTVKQGQTIGITGMIGSGKSTLLMVMTGMLKPEPGSVFLNGIDVRSLNPESIYDKISIVSQNPFLFSRTIAANIALGVDAELDQEDIEAAARNAGLEMDVKTFPDRYEQVVGERGITLSGGQKQRVAIARALCRQTPALVLDDPMSNIDARTEEKILNNLKSLNHNQTLIIVSHRISALKNSDKIYVLDKGKIVEKGNHAALMRKKGLYSRLALMQQLEKQLDRN